MERFKLFLVNFFVYGFGGVVGKIVPFVLLPIITRLMPSAEYFGISDIVITVVSFGSAIARMGMYDASFRLFFDHEEKQRKKQVFSAALVNVTIVTCFVFVAMILGKNTFSRLVFGAEGYELLWLIASFSVITSAYIGVLNVPIRAENRKKEYLLFNALIPIVPYFVSIPLLMNGQYLYALPIASLFSHAVHMVLLFWVNRTWIDKKKTLKADRVELFKIGAPLMPCFLIYWVFNSCDKLMILHYIDANANGIYAIGGKMGQLSHLIYTAFAGGWQYFAFSTMKDKDQTQLTSKIYEYLSIISFVAGCVMMVFSDGIFRLFFEGDYQKGSIVAPYLFMSPLLLMLYQTIGNQFLVIKKSWVSPVILSIGAMTNVLLNYMLIPKVGIEGAAYATILAYVVINIIALVVLGRMKLIGVTNRYLVLTLAFIVFWIMWRFVFGKVVAVSIVLCIGYILLTVLLYRHDIKKIMGMAIRLIKK